MAASTLIGTMLTAIRKVHRTQGVWAAQGGWEYNAVLIAALFALIDTGPGELSVDAALGRDEWGPGWALGGLALGAATSSAAIAMGSRAPAPGMRPQRGGRSCSEREHCSDPTTVETDKS
jgi:putative oxidoreductase